MQDRRTHHIPYRELVRIGDQCGAGRSLARPGTERRMSGIVRMMLMPFGRSGMHEQTSGRNRGQREIDHCGDTGNRTDEVSGSIPGHTSYLRHLAEFVY